MTSNLTPPLWRRSLILAAALALLLPLAAARGQVGDAFFDSDIDGGWIGTIAAGKTRIPFQLNVNTEGKDGVGFLIMGDQAEGGPTSLEVFGADFTKVKSKKIIFRIDDSAPLRVGVPAHGTRFGTATLKLSYKGADDSLRGRISGSTKGKIVAARMSTARPLQRLWQGSFKTGGQTIFVQLATTEDEDGVIGGHATFDGETSTAEGQRNGNTVNMSFDLDDQPITFSGKLKTKNNKLAGSFTSEGESNKATLVPADGNGKPMKLKKVQRLAAVDLTPGQSQTVRMTGKNIALGAVAFTDVTDVRVTAVELESAKALSVTVATSASAAEGAAVAMRLFNGDGETADKANALSVAAGDGGGDPVDFELQIQPIFTNNCTDSGCHGAAGAKAGLILDANAAFNNIVNIPSSQQPDLLRVRPGNAADSYLARKISGDPRISGDRMPKSRAPLPQEQIDLIKLWITQGASDASRLEPR